MKKNGHKGQIAPEPTPADKVMASYLARALLETLKSGKGKGGKGDRVTPQAINQEILDCMVMDGCSPAVVALVSYQLGRVLDKERQARSMRQKRREAAIYHAARISAGKRMNKTDIARILAGENGTPENYRGQAAKLVNDPNHKRMVESFLLDPPPGT